MDKLDMKSKDIVNENIEKILELFPNVIVESENGKSVDFDLLKQELSREIIEGNKEKYQLTWPGKKEAIANANTPCNKTLRPLKEKSVDFENTQNIYIEGDNLEVLKILQESYLNKIKCIYIDPPYNTGNDFIYNDNFEKNIKLELEQSGQIDQYNNKLITNNESNGRFHGDWLSMMYPRLKLSKNLLTNDGVMFISIDDNEVDNLKKIVTEIFGDGNVDSIIWQKTDSKVDRNTNAKIINRYKEIHESIIIAYKNKNNTFFNKMMKFPDWKQKQNNPDNDPRGNWQSGIISYEEGHKNEKKDSEYYYTITTPSGKEITRHWFVLEDEFKKLNDDNRIFYPKDGEGVPRLKTFENEEKEYFMDSILRGVGTSSSAKDEIEELFGDRDVFPTPKPTKMLKELIRVATNEDDIILDFFSGSSSTAHAIMMLNAEKKDTSNRKYILNQLPEKTDNHIYETICDIGEARIKKAAKKIYEEIKKDIDYGFRVYKVDSSNMKDVFYMPNEIRQTQLGIFESNIKEDRNSEDLLIQVMLDMGVTLDLKIEEKNIFNNKVYFVDENSLVACFDDEINIDIVDKICECKPIRVVFKDESFKFDNDKINLQERFKKLSPNTEICIL